METQEKIVSPKTSEQSQARVVASATPESISMHETSTIEAPKEHSDVVSGNKDIRVLWTLGSWLGLSQSETENSQNDIEVLADYFEGQPIEEMLTNLKEIEGRLPEGGHRLRKLVSYIKVASQRDKIEKVLRSFEK